jgi:hypothetical protein
MVYGRFRQLTSQTSMSLQKANLFPNLPHESQSCCCRFERLFISKLILCNDEKAKGPCQIPTLRAWVFTPHTSVPPLRASAFPLHTSVPTLRAWTFTLHTCVPTLRVWALNPAHKCSYTKILGLKPYTEVFLH